MILALYIAAESGLSLQAVDTVELQAGRGIVGDRNFNRSQTISAKDTRRKVITEGVNLSALVGKTFSIATVRFKGVALCEALQRPWPEFG